MNDRHCFFSVFCPVHHWALLGVWLKTKLRQLEEPTDCYCVVLLGEFPITVTLWWPSCATTPSDSCFSPWIQFDSGENNVKFNHIAGKLLKPHQDVCWDDELDVKWANALSLIVFIVIEVIEPGPWWFNRAALFKCDWIYSSRAEARISYWPVNKTSLSMAVATFRVSQYPASALTLKPPLATASQCFITGLMQHPPSL